MSKKVITMVLYNRPAYTQTVLEHLKQCRGIEEYTLFVHIEPGHEAVIELAGEIDFVSKQITINKTRLGGGRNTFLAWEHGFSEADFIVHIEDDTVPARDCLAFMEHCRHAYESDHSIFSVASYNRFPCMTANFYRIGRRPAYTCWLVGTWRNRWNWIRNNWSPDPERYATHVTKLVAKEKLDEVYPLLSRSQNIGAEGGIHPKTAAWFHKNHHTDHWAGNYDVAPGGFFE